MKSIGTQIAIDMYNCSDILLDDVIGIEHMLSSAAARFGMEPSGVYVNDEDGIDEYSVFAHCKQGHITMHVYPDMGFATIDIFTCFKEPTPTGWHALCANTSIPTNPKSLIWNAAISATKAI